MIASCEAAHAGQFHGKSELEMLHFRIAKMPAGPPEYEEVQRHMIILGWGKIVLGRLGVQAKKFLGLWSLGIKALRNALSTDRTRCSLSSRCALE